MANKISSRTIPSLDGLRAVAVLMVIAGHLRSSVLDRIPFNASFRRGGVGVGIFFVISGFLITHLLIEEQNKTGQLDLKRFYLRRSFRIFPPFYVFLGFVAVLSAFKVFHVGLLPLLAAATYTWNYVPTPETWPLGHCWSLALEEQFYLLWPACMAWCSRRTALAVSFAIILISPVSRVVTYLAWPSMRSHIGMMLHTHVDGIMMGCFLSLALDGKVWHRALSLTRHALTPVLSLLFLFGVDSYAENRWHGGYMVTVGFSLENVAIAALLLFVVFRHKSLLGRLLNLPALKHIGVISYSLYLWQQLFTGPFTHPLGLSLLGTAVCAELSYLLVERPSLRVRDSVISFLLGRGEASRKGAPFEEVSTAGT